jgi:3-dehydrosphinganine reductase
MQEKYSFSGKNIVITGGSAGIGLATAAEFARCGGQVFLLARDRTRLEAAAAQILAQTSRPVGGLFPVDVADRAAVEAAVRAVGEGPGGLAAIVLSAGTTALGYFGDLPVEEFERVWQVNYAGALYALKAAWPYLAAAPGGGRVGIVSSVAGYTGLIGYTAYAPPKFAMTGLAEALRMEGRRLGIRTTIIYPPDTDTAMYRYEQTHTVAEARALSANAGLLRPEAVARRLVRAMERGQFDVLMNGESRLIRVLKGVWPALYYAIIDRLARR